MFNKVTAIMILITALTLSLISGNAFAEDRLVIKDDGGSVTFSVQDDGSIFTGSELEVKDSKLDSYVESILNNTASRGAAGFALINSQIQWKMGVNIYNQLRLRDETNGHNVLVVEAGCPADSFYISSSGDVGIGTNNPTASLYVVGDIYATGSISQGSSRSLKENISNLTEKQAFTALKELTPVNYQYKADKSDQHVGFIAEDVPGLVATKDRKSVNPLDIVAVVTKVVQEQQKMIEELRAEVSILKEDLKTATNRSYNPRLSKLNQ